MSKSEPRPPRPAPPKPKPQKNVLGGELKSCSEQPMTGFFRDGCCNTGPHDTGAHTVCAELTAEFLQFSKDAGNDLSTPRPEFEFPGLNPGDTIVVDQDGDVALRRFGHAVDQLARMDDHVARPGVTTQQCPHAERKRHQQPSAICH